MLTIWLPSVQKYYDILYNIETREVKLSTENSLNLYFFVVKYFAGGLQKKRFSIFF